MPKLKKSVEEEVKPEVAADGGEVAEKPVKASKSERVSLFSKGVFTLFSVGKEYVVEKAGRVIGRPSTEEEGVKLVQDLNR